MTPVPREHPLRRLFAALVEDAFCNQVGMCDPSLTDYLSDLLVSFTHVDRLDALRRVGDRKLEQVAAMLAAQSEDAPADPVQRDCAVYRGIGDYTLFWTGVYPEQLERRRSRPTDVFLDYVTQGKRSYAITSELTRVDALPAPAFFRHLSDDFEQCVHGLGLVRKGLERSGQLGAQGGELLY